MREVIRSIPVIYSFARSGGTLVNQLLGVHPLCLVLSEVNPAASYKPVAEQAVEWLRLVPSGEASEFSRLSYQEKILVLYERASLQQKRLIVRDWVTVNFMPKCAGDTISPSGQLEQSLYLEYAGFRLLPLVISRRSAAVYESIKHNFSHLQNLDLDEFANAYLQYSRSVAEFPIIHMEALRARPDFALMEILQRFNLDIAGRQLLLNGFHTFQACTGNTTLMVSSKSASVPRILPPESVGSLESSCIGVHAGLVEADRLLGYD